MNGNITAEQVRAGRAMVRMQQRDLAAAVGINPGSLQRIEAGSGPLHSPHATVAKLVEALQAAGVEFIWQDGRPGVVLTRAPDTDAS